MYSQGEVLVGGRNKRGERVGVFHPSRSGWASVLGEDPEESVKGVAGHKGLAYQQYGVVEFVAVEVVQ